MAASVLQNPDCVVVCGLPQVLAVHAEDGVTHVQPPGQVGSHAREYLGEEHRGHTRSREVSHGYLGDEDGHLVLHAALDGDAEAARLARLADHHLPPPGRHVAGGGG